MLIKKGDTVRYGDKICEVLTVYKNSDLVVIQEIGKRRDIVYTWSRHCRKVDGNG